MESWTASHCHGTSRRSLSLQNVLIPYEMAQLMAILAFCQKRVRYVIDSPLVRTGWMIQ